MEYYILLVLVLLLIAQQVYWTYFTNKLLNKLMSRNYIEYVQTENLAKPKVKAQMLPVEDDPDAIRQAQQINALMGLG